MAVTSIWPIKGRIDKVINYARNPEKTTEAAYDEQAQLHIIDGVLEYAASDIKTEHRAYVSCLNCSEFDAASQYMDTKRFWGKLDGRACYHGYQSFRSGEVNAEIAHRIGVRLAEELWGDRFEVVVATHCNTGHYHNHFVINSVSWADGYKFYNAPADYSKMRNVSDRLCREFSISTIAEPSGYGKHYSEWQAEKYGKPTFKSGIRQDIDRAILASTTKHNFIKTMVEMGYEIKTHGKSGAPLKYAALKPPDANGYFRFYKLGEGYSLEEIMKRILQNTHKQLPFPEAEYRRPKRYRYRGTIPPRSKLSGLQALYYRYCYELHIINKQQAPVKQVSFLLREDAIKLDKFISQARFLCTAGITGIEILLHYRQKASADVDLLISQRQQLRNKLKSYTRIGDSTSADAIKSEISNISSQLKKLKKEIVLCDDIAERSAKINNNLDALIHQKEIERKEHAENELFRGRSRTGRPYDIGGR